MWNEGDVNINIIPVATLGISDPVMQQVLSVCAFQVSIVCCCFFSLNNLQFFTCKNVNNVVTFWEHLWRTKY